jgi:hypothetical protein
MSNMEFVLRFTLSHPGLSTTIVGTSNPVHLASNIAVAGRGPLPSDLYEEAKKHLPPAAVRPSPGCPARRRRATPAHSLGADVRRGPG